MSLLDKQEVQDLCEHTALLARKWSIFIVNERLKIRHCRARSAEERRRRRMPNRDFFTSRGAYVKLRYIAMLYTHSIGNQP